MLSAEWPFDSLRVIPYQRFNGAQNMAIDYSLATAFNPQSKVILRFYGWKPYCLSLGKHQKISEVDFNALYADGFDLVRRPTGGSAIFHAKELTYSLIAPLKDVSHQYIYLQFHKLLVHVLTGLGYSVELHTTESRDSYLNQGAKTFACFNRPAFAEIKYRGKKLVGSAQRIFGNVLLQHGSILLDSTQNIIWKYVRTKAREKRTAREWLEKNSVSLYDILQKEVDPLQLSQHIIDNWPETGQNCVVNQALTSEELTYSEKFIEKFKIQFNQEVL